MRASADGQVLPALVCCSAVYVVLPRRADHHITLIDDNAMTGMLDESLARNAHDDLALVMAVRGGLGASRDLHNANVQFVIGGRSLQPGQVKAGRSRCLQPLFRQECIGGDVPHHIGQG